jgi:preprotein translocase subunit SecE
MAAKAEGQGSAFDTVKLTAATVLLIAGVGVFYYFADASQLYRVLGLIGVAAMAIAILATTEKGRTLWAFLQDARTEVRKMVWPSRTETVQTTLVVFVVVILVAIFLWLLDMLLAWLVRFVIG